MWWKLQAFRTWQTPPSRHIFICWGTNQLEDDLELIGVTVSGQNWLSGQHLAEYTAY